MKNCVSVSLFNNMGKEKKKKESNYFIAKYNFLLKLIFNR